MNTGEKILKRIEMKRHMLYETIKKYGVSSMEALICSKELDELLSALPTEWNDKKSPTFSKKSLIQGSEAQIS